LETVREETGMSLNQLVHGPARHGE
jgi:hypothetical protein